MTDQFHKHLARLKKRNPSHAIIPVVEEMGPCVLSMMYIDFALEEEPEVVTPEDQMRVYFAQTRKLYSQRAVLSNKFLECNTDAERAEVSIAIGSIQAEIIRVRQIIDEYKRTGEPPKAGVKINQVMDGRRKEKKLRSVLSSISYYRGLIRKEQDPDKIKAYESKIEDLQSLARELAA